MVNDNEALGRRARLNAYHAADCKLRTANLTAHGHIIGTPIQCGNILPIDVVVLLTVVLHHHGNLLGQRLQHIGGRACLKHLNGSERRRPHGNLACRRLDDQLAGRLERRALDGALERVLADNGKLLVQVIRIPRDRDLVRVTIGIGHGDLLGQLPRHGIGLGIALNRNLRHLGYRIDRRRGGNDDLDRQVAVHRYALGDNGVAIGGGSGRDLGPRNLRLRRGLAILHTNGRLHALERITHDIGGRVLGNANARDRLNGLRNLGIALYNRHRALGLDRSALDCALKRDVTQLAQGIRRERGLIPGDGSSLL